jgi:hypothetical protein
MKSIDEAYKQKILESLNKDDKLLLEATQEEISLAVSNQIKYYDAVKKLGSPTLNKYIDPLINAVNAYSSKSIFTKAANFFKSKTGVTDGMVIEYFPALAASAGFISMLQNWLISSGGFINDELEDISEEEKAKPVNRYIDYFTSKVDTSGGKQDIAVNDKFASLMSQAQKFAIISDSRVKKIGKKAELWIPNFVKIQTPVLIEILSQKPAAVRRVFDPKLLSGLANAAINEAMKVFGDHDFSTQTPDGSEPSSQNQSGAQQQSAVQQVQAAQGESLDGLQQLPPTELQGIKWISQSFGKNEKEIRKTVGNWKRKYKVAQNIPYAALEDLLKNL